MMHFPLLIVVLVIADQLIPATDPRPPATDRVAQLRRGNVETRRYGAPRQLATLENRRIKESSGLAASLRRPDVYWTHNDSGDRPRLFAFDHRGKDLGEVSVKGAKAIDWEDMCSFDGEHGPCLLLADVGDNSQRRSSCQLYLIDEPKEGKKKAKIRQMIRFRYETGPQDCEAVAADPTTKTVYLVAKRFALTCPVFALKIPEPNENAVQIAKPIARLGLPMATAMDISRDGRRAVVLTYGHAYEYERRPGENWSQAFSRSPSEVKMPARRQGEAICYDAEGRSLKLTSERTGSPFWEVPLRN